MPSKRTTEGPETDGRSVACPQGHRTAGQRRIRHRTATEATQGRYICRTHALTRTRTNVSIYLKLESLQSLFCQQNPLTCGFPPSNEATQHSFSRWHSVAEPTPPPPQPPEPVPVQAQAAPPHNCLPPAHTSQSRLPKGSKLRAGQPEFCRTSNQHTCSAEQFLTPPTTTARPAADHPSERAMDTAVAEAGQEPESVPQHLAPSHGPLIEPSRSPQQESCRQGSSAAPRPSSAERARQPDDRRARASS